MSGYLFTYAVIGLLGVVYVAARNAIEDEESPIWGYLLVFFAWPIFALVFVGLFIGGVFKAKRG